MSKRVGVASLTALLAMAGLVLAQVDAAPPAGRQEEAAKPDPAVEAWIQVLSQKIADQNPVIRASSHQALATVGPPALGHLKTLAAGDDEAVAAEARRVIERIERNQARPPGGRFGEGPGGAPGERGGRQAGGPNRVLEELNLTEEQRGKVDALQEANRNKTRELFAQVQDGTLTREEMRAAMADLRQELSKEMKGVLTEEQYKKYEEAMRNFGGGRRRRGDG